MNMKPEIDTAEPISATWGERLLAHLVQPVPHSVALCEFSCSATVCSAENWRHCQRRLDAEALQQGPESEPTPAT